MKTTGYNNIDNRQHINNKLCCLYQLCFNLLEKHHAIGH